MQCKEWGDANSELFKEPHDEAVHKNSYKSRLCELISAFLISTTLLHNLQPARKRWAVAPARQRRAPLWDYALTPLSADLYLTADDSLSTCTKILRLRLRMTVKGVKRAAVSRRDDLYLDFHQQEKHYGD